MSEYSVFAGMAQGIAVAHEVIEVGVEEEIVLSQNYIVGDHRGEGQAQESQAQDQLHLLVDLFLRMEFSGGYLRCYLHPNSGICPFSILIHPPFPSPKIIKTPSKEYNPNPSNKHS